LIGPSTSQFDASDRVQRHRIALIVAQPGHREDVRAAEHLLRGILPRTHSSHRPHRFP
jgi:hypothetical protein